MAETASSRRATIRDVAAAAGVSVATASRVLSGSSYPVSTRLRTKVQRAVTELDYVANPHARALSGARPQMIAMIAGSMRSTFYSEIAQRVAEEAAQHDRLCMYASSHANADTELALVSMLREQSADAVILIGGVIPTAEYTDRISRYANSLAAAGSRLVLCGRPGLNLDIPAYVVSYDNTAGAASMTSHLASRGHSRILHLAGPQHNTTAEDRVVGYHQALATHRIPADPALLEYGEFSRQSGYERTRRRVVDGAADFTAIFACDDLIASGAIRALLEAGLRVPADVSVAGYNDSDPSLDVTPPLTTVHIPADELGRTAVRMALAQSPTERHVTLGTHIVVRDSVTVAPVGRGG